MALELIPCYEMCSIGYSLRVVPVSTVVSESVSWPVEPCMEWDLLCDANANPLVRASLGKALGASAWEEILTPHLRAGMSSFFLTTYPHLRFREFLCES